MKIILILCISVFAFSCNKNQSAPSAPPAPPAPPDFRDPYIGTYDCLAYQWVPDTNLIWYADTFTLSTPVTVTALNDSDLNVAWGSTNVDFEYSSQDYFTSLATSNNEYIRFYAPDSMKLKDYSGPVSSSYYLGSK